MKARKRKELGQYIVVDPEICHGQLTLDRKSVGMGGLTTLALTRRGAGCPHEARWTRPGRVQRLVRWRAPGSLGAFLNDLLELENCRCCLLDRGGIFAAVNHQGPTRSFCKE